MWYPGGKNKTKKRDQTTVHNQGISLGSIENKEYNIPLKNK